MSPLPFGVHRVPDMTKNSPEPIANMSPLPFDAHPAPYVLTNEIIPLTKHTTTPLPFGVHRVHHRIRVFGASAGGSTVSIALGRAPRSTHDNETIYQTVPVSIAAFTTRPARPDSATAIRVSIGVRRSPRSPLWQKRRQSAAKS